MTLLDVAGCRDIIRLYGDQWNSNQRLNDGKKAANRWGKRWPLSKRILWAMRNGGSAAAAAGDLEAEYQRAKAATNGLTLPKFIDRIRKRNEAEIETDFYRNGITARHQPPDAAPAPPRRRQRTR